MNSIYQGENITINILENYYDLFKWLLIVLSSSQGFEIEYNVRAGFKIRGIKFAIPVAILWCAGKTTTL